MDERSTDETVAKLKQMGINFVQPPDIVGVTYNWNLARHPPVWCRHCCSCLSSQSVNLIMNIITSCRLTPLQAAYFWCRLSGVAFAITYRA